MECVVVLCGVWCRTHSKDHGVHFIESPRLILRPLSPSDSTDHLSKVFVTQPPTEAYTANIPSTHLDLDEENTPDLFLVDLAAHKCSNCSKVEHGMGSLNSDTMEQDKIGHDG